MSFSDRGKPNYLRKDSKIYKIVLGGNYYVNQSDATDRAYLSDLVNDDYKVCDFNDSISDFYDQVIVVKQAGDLTNIDSNKLYVIDGRIDMGTQQIEIPSGGFSYMGHSYFISSLYSSEDNYTMFINKPGEDSGNVRGVEVEHYVTGTSSQLFNLDNGENFGAIEFISCNFGTFSGETTSLGELTGYRQFATQDNAFIRVADGFTFSGNWSGGLLITDTIMLSIPAGASIFKEGTALLFSGSTRTNLNALSVDNTVTVFDFQESNFSIDWGFIVDNARFNKDSTPIPNLPSDSTKVHVSNSFGTSNTYVGGFWDSDTEVETVLSVGLASQILGTTNYSELVHFSSGGNNSLVYDSDVDLDFLLTGNIQIDGGLGDSIVVIVRKYDDSIASYVDIFEMERTIENSLGGFDTAYYVFNVPISLSENDRVELWVRNDSDNTNVTMKKNSLLFIRTRN